MFSGLLASFKGITRWLVSSSVSSCQVLGKYQCFFVSEKRLGVFIKFHEAILREEFYDVASERRNARVRN